MGKTIAVANQKGGVGKTTTTRNVAAALVERGKKLFLIDFDPQGALTISLGVNSSKLTKTIYDALINSSTPLDQVILSPKTGIDLAPANIDLSGAEVDLLNEIGRERILKEIIEPVQGRYDYIFIDCPPSLGLLTINALTAANGVFIPVQCQYLAFRGMQSLLRTIEKVRSRSNPQLRILGLLPTLFDARTTHSKEVLEELRVTYRKTLIDIPIRYRVGLADAMVNGQSILDLDNRSDIANIFREIAEVIDHD
ncbi:MAG: ParA family protein [Nitrososphaera sp.]